MASSSVGGTGGNAGCSPCVLPDGGGVGGGTITSGVEESPPSLSRMGFSLPASPVYPVNSEGGGTEFSGVTNTADWRCAASSACRLAAAAASASASFSRRAASSSLRFSCAFRSVASQRSAAGSIRRVVADVSTDPITEATATLSRVRGALK